jgi:hypothetical protein
MHTTASDGRHDIETMAIAARDAGRSYICITDHSQSLAMANGLDDARALAHAARIREANARVDGITILAGIEVDILADGRPTGETTLAAPTSRTRAQGVRPDRKAMTVRVLTAMACPLSTPSATRPGARSCAASRTGSTSSGSRRPGSRPRSRSTATTTTSTCRTSTRGGQGTAGRPADQRRRASATRSSGLLRWGG